MPRLSWPVVRWIGVALALASSASLLLGRRRTEAGTQAAVRPDGDSGSMGSATAATMAALLTAFELWAENELVVQLEAAMAQDLPLVTTVIQQAGWRAYEQCWARG